MVLWAEAFEPPQPLAWAMAWVQEQLCFLLRLAMFHLSSVASWAQQLLTGSSQSGGVMGALSPVSVPTFCQGSTGTGRLFFCQEGLLLHWCTLFHWGLLHLSCLLLLLH